MTERGSAATSDHRIRRRPSAHTRRRRSRGRGYSRWAWRGRPRHEQAMCVIRRAGFGHEHILAANAFLCRTEGVIRKRSVVAQSSSGEPNNLCLVGPARHDREDGQVFKSFLLSLDLLVSSWVPDACESRSATRLGASGASRRSRSSRSFSSPSPCRTRRSGSPLV